MAELRTSIHGEWSTRFAFILAATGSAVGLGNIWKFPYIAGQYGGGAFVLVYLLCVAVIGIPIMMSEILIGRRGKQSPFNTMRTLAKEEGRSLHWAWLGGVGALAGFLILSYYSVIAGQVMAYVFRALTGEFTSQSSDGIASLYNDFRSNPEAVLAWHTIFMVMTMIVVSRGVRGGLEKAVRYLMPALVILLLILVGYSMNTDAFHNAVSFLFNIDFKDLVFEKDVVGKFILDAEGNYQFTMDGVLAAMGHAFFTLSLGMGAIMIYGSYLKREVPIAKTAIVISIADTMIALVAGLAIFPIVFQHGLDPAAGPGLIFKTLPIAFGAMSYGQLMGALFFILLVFAAWTSAISLVEPAVTWAIEKLHTTRIKATVWVGIIIWLMGVITVFSVSGTTIGDIVNYVANMFQLAELELRHPFFSLTAFDVIDALVTLLLLPLGGLLIAFFAGWVMRKESSEDELSMRSPVSYKVWWYLVRYITPVAVLTVFIFGVVHWVMKNLMTQPTIT